MQSRVYNITGRGNSSFYKGWFVYFVYDDFVIKNLTILDCFYYFFLKTKEVEYVNCVGICPHADITSQPTIQGLNIPTQRH